MEQKIIEAIRNDRDDLARQIEELIQNFTVKTRYVVDKMKVEYKTPGLVPKDPSVRIWIHLGIGDTTNDI